MIELDNEDLLTIIYEDHEDWDVYGEERMSDGGRWYNTYSNIFKNNKTNQLISIQWYRGATEYQDEGPESITFQEVEEVEEMKMVKKYIVIN